MKWSFLTFILLASFTAFPKSSKELSGQYLAISKIKSPYELIAEYLPKKYTVSLSLSGSIADEIKPILDTLKIEMPRYCEMFDKKGGFQVVITNKEYTSQTCDLICGILNPIEMIGIILNAVLQYHEIESLLQMQKETTISEKKERRNDTLFTTFEIKPTGSRFYYKYRDMGTAIHETWLTRLTIAIDLKTMLAHELSITKYSRTFSAEQHNKPSAVVTKHDYVCTYTTVHDIIVPSRLDVSVDSKPTLRLSASYRQVENFILFDNRTIEYFLPGGSSSNCVILYQQYDFSTPQKTVKPVDSSGKYASTLKKAAAHAREAMEALNKGDIQSAVSLFQTIIENYPGTPQAVEAQKLLSGLPNGL